MGVCTLDRAVTTYSHAEITPRAARRATQRRTNFGTYVAGIGATAALTAAALVAFLSVTAFLAFNGFPFAGSSEDAGAAYLDATADPATAAGRAVATARTAVARNPVSASGGGRSDVAGGAGGAGGPGEGSGQSGTGKSDGEPSAGAGATIPQPAPAPSPAPAPVAGVVQGVSGAVGASLPDVSGATDAVGGAVSGASDDVGGAAGRPDLGEGAGAAVDQVTHTVLPSSGGGVLLGD